MNDIDLLTAARPDVDKLDRADKQRLYSAITNHSSISTEDPADQTPFQLIPVVGHDRRRTTLRHFAIGRAAVLIVVGIVGVAGLLGLTRDTPVTTDQPGSPGAPATALPTTTTTTATDTLQDQILADGVVTEIELTASQDATVACIEAGGFNAYYGGPDGHSLISSAPDTKTDQLHRVVETCEVSNWTRVSMRYASGHLPETFDMEAIWTCLRDSDLVATSDNDPTTAFQQALSINPRAAENCIKPGRPALTPPT